MTDDSLMGRIREHVAHLCDLEPSVIKPDGKLVAYGLDSIRAMDLILTLEEELDVALPEHDPELARVETLRQFTELVRRRLGSPLP